MAEQRKKKKETNDYVNNKKLYTEITKYIEKVREAKEKNLEKPRIPEYIGACFYHIAENLSHLYKFRNYKFREDMIMDAVLNCVQYCDNFDPDKTQNPFSYFTQISFYAFIRRIEKEKTYLYTKYKSIENTEIFAVNSDSQHDYDETGHSADMKYSENSRENMNDFIASYEDKMKKKKDRRKKSDEDSEADRIDHDKD